jgi:hypothetical protein
VMLSHPEAVAKVIEAAATRSLTSSATPRPGPERGPGRLNYLRKSGEHPMSVNVLYQTSTRATVGRDGHSGRRFRTYLQPMRGSSLELRGDSRNVRNCCIYVVTLSRKTI